MQLLDTNILIANLATNNSKHSIVDSAAISRITYIELLSWSKLSADECKQLTAHLNAHFLIFEITLEVADTAATIRRTCSITLGDALILATCLIYKCTLVTKDKKLAKLFVKLRDL